jgi:hypothetical protein
MSHFRGFVVSSFTTTSPWPATSEERKHTNQSAIDWPSRVIKADPAKNAHDSFNDLDNKNQEQCKINKAKDDQYAVGYPTACTCAN